MINDLLRNNSMTKYRLSKLSNIPYTTINDICSGRADIKKCSVDSVYRIANVFGLTMEELIKPYYEDERSDFELFKSNTCHRLKELGDVDFIVDMLESDIIASYYQKKWYKEAFYLLAMLDYVSRENDVPLCDRYDDYRLEKLSETIFPRSVLMISAVSNSDAAKKTAVKDSIPEFIRHNIVESEVRNVI